MSTERRLSSTLRSFSEFYSNPILLPLDNPPAGVSPLVVLVDNVFFFPLEWRKYILEFCRIQASQTTNEALVELAASVLPRDITLVYTHSGIDRPYSTSFDTIKLNYLECLAYSHYVRFCRTSYAQSRRFTTTVSFVYTVCR